ncbi:MAG TPA: TIGR03118 family protein [Candidatus Binataceae bacterium]|nr:TIGR03118 family protein [Candidatus Binataceae bacterium]
MKRSLRKILATATCAASLATTPIGAAYAGYVQKNLISNNTNMFPAAHEDTSLVNPWGIAFFPGGPFWINDNGTGLSALYNGDGTGFLGADPAPAVTVPPPKGSTATSAPTGIVANSSFGFNLKSNSMPAAFIFATEDGTISAWNLDLGIPAIAELEVDNSQKKCSNGAKGAVYKGLATGETAAGVFLYATNFRCATVDVFGSDFKPAVASHNFRDSQIPDGFAPFGIANIRGNLVVTYAKQDPAKHDDEAGAGNGFVDIFDTNGILLQRFAQYGVLNSPWGIAEAPFNFGQFSNDLLIGNFGNGRINAFRTNRMFHGTLTDASNKPIAIDGLWSIIFGGGAVSSPSTLYFSSGPAHESGGLVGELLPQP